MTKTVSIESITPAYISSRLTTYLNAHPAIDLKGEREAAVLLPLMLTPEGIKILYTRRSEKLKNHRGQVAFPGGGADPDDKDSAATALREAYEEIGLHPGDVTLLGKMTTITSTSRYNVTPVVGWINHPFDIVPNPDEVARVFSVPLAWIADRHNVDFRDLETPWGRHRDVVFFKKYDGETIWGFTGHLTVQLLKILGLFE